MRPTSRLICAGSIAAFLAAFSSAPTPSRAAMVYWDTDGATAGAGGVAPVGSWNAANWSSSSAGTAATSAWQAGDIAVFSAGTNATGTFTISITGTQSIGGLVFEEGNATLSGGALSVASASDLFVATGVSGRIDSTLSGAGALRKLGTGSLRLGNAANNFNGPITIAEGVLSVTSIGALGAGTSTITVTGNTTRAQGGGQLALGGGFGAAGLTLNRDVSITGGGPGGDGFALLSVGDNVFNGSFATQPTAATRLAAIAGTTTINGPIFLANNTTSQFNGLGHWVLNGGVTLTAAASSLLDKQGGGGMIIAGSVADIFGEVRASAGSLRIGSDSNLFFGTLSPNGGVLEVRTDNPGAFVNAKVVLRGGNSANAIFADRAAGSLGAGGLLNQTIVFADTSFVNNNTTHGFNSRNGYGVTLTGAPAAGNNITFATGNVINITNNMTGLLTFNGNLVYTDGTSRVYTFQGNGETLVTGNFAASGAVHTVAKLGTGTMTVQGTASTHGGGITVGAGTLAATQMAATGPGAITLGATTTAGAFSYLGASGAGETSGKVFNLTGSTGNGILLANQSGTPLLLTSSIAATGVGAKSLILGGTSTLDNEIDAAIQENSVANKTGLAKIGSGTWVYAPAAASFAAADGSKSTTGGGAVNTNTLTLSSTAGLVLGQSVSGANVPANSVITAIDAGTSTVTISTPISTAVTSGTPLTFGAVSSFTGNVTVTGGTLKFRPTANTGNGSDLIASTATLTFDADTGAGLPGVGMAGGTFELVGSAGAGTLTESLGTLNANAGAGVVKITPGAGTPKLTFSGLGTIASGTGVNIVGASATNPVTVTGTTGFLNPHLYFNGADFAYSGASAVLRAISYGSDAGTNTVNAAAALTAASHNLITATSGSSGTVTQSSGITVASLKFDGSRTLTGNGTVTVQTAANGAGGILVTGGSATLSGGGGITSGGSGDLVFRIDGVSDTLTLTNATAILGTTTGGITKNGAGKLVFGGNQSYTGTTTINEGTLQLSASSRLGGSGAVNSNALTIRQGATLELNGANGATGIGVGAFNGAGTVTNSSGTASLLTIGNGGASGVFSGLISGNLGVTKRDGGTTMSLTGVNTYTGATSIIGGTLVVTNLADYGSASSIGTGSTAASNAAALVFNTGTLQYTGSNAQIFQATQTPSVSTNRLFTLAGNGTIDSSGTFGNNFLVAGAANNATLRFSNTGAIAFSGAGTRTLTLTGSSTGDNEMRPQLINNPNANEALSLTKSGTGLWILNPSVANVYTGTTTISGGTLQAQDGLGLPSNSLLTISSGVFQSSGSFTRTLGASAGQVQITGGTSGFSASSGKLTVSLSGNAGLTWGAAAFNPSTLNFSSSSALAAVELTNPIDLGASTRTVNIDDNPTTALDFAILSGVLTGAGGGLTKNGGGTLYLTGANSYSGNTTVGGGTLGVSSFGGGAVATSSLGGPAGSVIVSGTLSYIGNGEVTSRLISMNGNTTIDASGAGALVLTNLLNNTASAKTLTITGASGEVNELRNLTPLADNGGVLNVTKSGGGTWIISGTNTYTGNTTVQGGALGIGGDSALGTGTLLMGLVNVGDGIVFASDAARTITNPVIFRGGGTEGVIGNFSLTLNGPITYGNNSGNSTLTNSLPAGTLLTFGPTSTLKNLDSSTGRVFAVNGTGDMLISGLVQDGATAPTIMQWSSTGRLQMTGANSYTGTTTITAGALQATDSAGLPSSSNLVLGGGVFQSTGAPDFTRAIGAAAGNVQWTGSGGFAAAGGALTLNLNSGTTLVWGGGTPAPGANAATPNFISGGNSLIFGSTTADSEVNWTNPLDLNNTTGAVTRTIVVNDNAASSTDTLRIGASNGSLVQSGSGATSITKSGAGTLVIDKNGADTSNAFGGTLTINGGTLILRGTPQNTAGALTMSPSATGTTLILEQGAILRRPATFNTGAGPAVGGISILAGPGGGEIRLNNAAAIATRTFIINDNTLVDDDVTITVPLINGDSGNGAVHFSKEGGGRLVMSGNNAYAGATLFFKGAMVLDYNASTTQKLSDFADLEPRGGTLIFKGSNTGAVSETVGNLSPGSSNLGIQNTTPNPNPGGMEPGLFGSLTGVGNPAPNGGASIIQLQPSATQALSVTFKGFIRNPGGGIAMLSTTDAARGQFLTPQNGDLANGGLLATNVLLGGRWIAQTAGVITRAFGTVEPDLSQWQSFQSIELNGNPTGTLGVNRVAGLTFGGSDSALSLNNGVQTLTLTNAAILVAPESTASLVQIAGGKLMTELPYKTAPGADILLENFSTGVLKVTSNLGHSDAPQGNIPLITIAGPGVTELAGKSSSLITYVGTQIFRGAVKVIGGATLRVSGGDAISDYTALDLGSAGNVGGNFVLAPGASEAIGGFVAVNTNQGVTTGNVDLGASGTLTINQNIASTYAGPMTGSGTLIKQGNATLTSNGSALTFNGAVQVTGGLLDLTGNLTDGLTGNISEILLRGGEIRGEHNSGGLAALNKLPDSATVRLEGTQGAGLRITSNTFLRSEDVAALAVSAGANTVTVDAANTTSRLDLNFIAGSGGLTRTNGATLLARGDALGSGGGAVISFNSPLGGLLVGGGASIGTKISILPWAIGTTIDPALATSVGDSFVTYGANGLRPLNTLTEYATTYGSATATDNFAINTSQSSLATKTVNSLRIDTSAGAVTMGGAGGGVLTIGSGAILVSAGANANNATLNGYQRIAAGANDAIPDELVVSVTTSNAVAPVLTISSDLSNNGAAATSVTKTGNGTLVLTSQFNDFTGGLTINQGAVEFSHITGNNLGNGALRLAGGTLRYTGGGAVNLSGFGAIQLLGPASYYTPTGTGAAGNALSRGSTLDLGAQSMTISSLSGSGGLVKLGTGTLTVTQPSSATGTIAILQGGASFNNTLNSLAGFYIMPENFTGADNTVTVAVKQNLSVQQLIVGGVYTAASTLNGTGNLIVGDALNHPAVTIGNGSGDSLLMVGYHDEGAGNGAANTLTRGLLDLKNAASVDINVSRLLVGQNKGSGSGRIDGDVVLSDNTNNVTAGFMAIGDNPNNQLTLGDVQQVTLGPGANNFNVDTLIVGGQNGNGKMVFAGGGLGGTFTLRDRAGTGGANLYIGDNDDNTSTLPDVNTTTLDTIGGTINANLNLLVVGRHAVGAGGGGGALRFDGALSEINAVTVLLAQTSTRGVSTTPTNTIAEITQDGGTFRFGTMSQGGGNVQYNWTAGTIAPYPGMDGVNENVLIDNNANGFLHYVAVPAGRTLTFERNAGFTGDADITKIGPGTLIMKSTLSSYGGGTDVMEGLFLANNTFGGSATGPGIVNVYSGAELGGSGAISGETAILPGGKLSVGGTPGDIGSLSIGTGSTNLFLDADSTLQLEIRTRPATPEHDLLIVNGTLNLDTDNDPQTTVTLSITDLDPRKLPLGTHVTLIQYNFWDGGLFTFNGQVVTDYDAALNPNSTTFYIDGFGFQLDYDAGSGNQVDLVAVPEPGTLASLIGGVGMLLGLQRFRRWGAKT